MICKDLMNKNIIYCSQSASISLVSSLMEKYDVGFLPVWNDTNGEIVGVITDRDIIKRVLAKGYSVNERVNNYMTKNVIYTHPNDDITIAISKMADFKIKRILIMENNKLVGIISLKDLALNKETNKLVNELLREISDSKTINPIKYIPNSSVTI